MYFNICLKPQVILYCCTTWLTIVRLFRNMRIIILILYFHPQALNHCSKFSQMKNHVIFLHSRIKSKLKIQQ